MNMDICIGAYYENLQGQVLRTSGWNGQARTVSYHFDDGEYGRVATVAEWPFWKLRNDLRDFPNARDPSLPYEFDLNWDIKHLSELHKMLQEDPDIIQLYDTAKRYDLLQERTLDQRLEASKKRLERLTKQAKETHERIIEMNKEIKELNDRIQTRNNNE